MRPSLRALGLVLAALPWVAAPAAFSMDQLDEAKSLAVAVGVTLCLGLMLREARRVGRDEGTPWRAWLGVPFNAGTVLAVAGLLISALASPVVGLGLLSITSPFLFILFAAGLAARPAREAELRWILGCLLAVMSLEALMALGQAFAPGAMRQLTPWGPVPSQTGRSAIVGTIGNPEYLAGWLASGLAAAALLLWRDGADGRGGRDPLRLLAGVAAALIISVIFISGGRGALLAAGGALAAAGIVAWLGRALTLRAAEAVGAPESQAPPALWRRKSVLALAAAGGLLVLLLAVWAARDPELRRGGLPGRLAELANPYSPSIRHRVGLLAVTSRIIANHPLLGVGPGRYGWAYGETQARLARDERGVGFWALGDVMTGNFVGEAHCDPLQWWAEYGLAAPLGLTLMLAGALAGAAWTLRRRGEGSAAGAACWAALASFAINMWVAFPLQRPVRALTFWALLGLVAGLRRGNAE